MLETRLHGAFHVLVPVKPLRTAKSRLERSATESPGVGPADRRTLALAFALDTIDQLSQCPLVGDLSVLTRDAEVTQRVRALGVRTVPPQHGVSGLNDEVDWALKRHASAGRPTAVVVSDLPAATAGEFTTALTAVHEARRAAHVPDLRDGGTTLIGSRWGGELIAGFGAMSSSHFYALGYSAVGLDLVGVRCDVDTTESLRLATYMHVGAFTRAALRDIATPLHHLDCPTRQSG